MADKIAVKLLDGREVSVETTTYMCSADRLAFERRFQLSTEVIRAYRDRFDEKGRAIPGADMTGFREEWIYFFAWRVLSRQTNGQLPADFDAFCDVVEDLELDIKPTSETPDPTTAAQPSTS